MDLAATLGTYLRIVWRKRWLLVLPLLLCTAASVVALQYLPRVYRATTLILVQAANIPSDYVKPTVRTEEGLRTIRQQVTSRTRLEQVARDLNLFPLDDGDRRKVESEISSMRSRIDLRVKEERSFTLSYVSDDPQEAARVANRLAELFIEWNALRRQSLARDTSEFLADELDRMRLQLGGQETALAEFKRRYQPELPAQQDANLRALDSLRRELRDDQMSLERARDRKALLATQLSALPAMDQILQEGEAIGPSDPHGQLARAREELYSLRLRYTDKYPEVQRLQGRVRELARIVSELPLPEVGSPTLVANPAHDRLRGEVQVAQLEVTHLEQELVRIREEIEDYRQRVENAPTREQELLSLTRDYDTLRQNYGSLLNKKTEAQIAESLEVERQGEQFIVLDRAMAPATPFRPDPVQLISMGILAGLTLGVGWVLFLEQLRPTFYSPQQVQEALGVPVIAAVPVIGAGRRRRGGKADAAVWLMAIGAAVEMLRTLPGLGG